MSIQAGIFLRGSLKLSGREGRSRGFSFPSVRHKSRVQLGNIRDSFLFPSLPLVFYFPVEIVHGDLRILIFPLYAHRETHSAESMKSLFGYRQANFLGNLTKPIFHLTEQMFDRRCQGNLDLSSQLKHSCPQEICNFLKTQRTDFLIESDYRSSSLAIAPGQLPRR